MKTCIYACLLAVCQAFAEDLQVDLKDPSWKNGVLYTTQGGVVQTEGLRIQARTIQYFHREEEGQLIQKIEAEGDLLLQYKNRVFVGSELSFDFVNKTGTIYDGKTSTAMWYIGGDEIQLNADASYRVKNAFLTTCENKQSTWDFFAKSIKVVKDQRLEAKSLRFRYLQIPLFGIPSLRLNLHKMQDPIFRYYLNWHKGPKAGFRYQLYSWKEAALFGRLEYRWKVGWGGAIEAQYFPEHQRTTFVSRNYVGTDYLFNAPDAEFRYRVQGAFQQRSENGQSTAHITWDKYSDVRMPGDFKFEDFEVDTALKTQARFHYLDENFITQLNVRPRVNPFESIKQDLPSFYATLRTLPLGATGIISTSYLRAAYLNFQYSTQLLTSLQNFHSPRIEVFEKLYRPIHIKALTLAPNLGGQAIFYGTSPSHHPQLLGLLSYGLKAYGRGYRQFSNYRHMIEPYILYQALSRPTVSLENHYIFSIQDGYKKLQQVEIGIRHQLFSSAKPYQEAHFVANLYANAFFQDPVMAQLIPKAYLDLTWNLPSILLTLNNCYNFWQNVWDYSNAQFKWTANEHVAFSVEGRYRSKYDWRKADHTNFVLDVSRPLEELLESPLSDRRVSLLTNLFIRLNPFWELQFESHHGFYRLYKNHIDEAPFTEFKVHLYTWISTAWKLHIYYGYTVHNHFDWNIDLQLVKKQF